MIKELELIEDFGRLNLEISISSTYISDKMLVINNEFLEKMKEK